LPVIYSIAKQKLSFDLHSPKLQQDYGAQTTVAIVGSWKWKVRKYIIVKIQLWVVTDRQQLGINGKRVVDIFLERISCHEV